MRNAMTAPIPNTAETFRAVAVLGASPNPERYSNMAVVLLKEMGFQVVPVHPALPEIEGLTVVKYLGDIQCEIHTLTLYVGAKHLPPLLEEIVRLGPRRVIFNPGTENAEVIEALRQSEIECVEGCTLVMLKTGQF